MNLERYEVEQLSEISYRFFSIGSKGTFEIHIRFIRTIRNSYNLGFGVVDSAWLDDQIEIRNGDSQKILATVANVALTFLEEHPSARIYATGSTASRTRLYQMGINRFLPMLTEYTVAGYIAVRDDAGNTEGHFPFWKGDWHEFCSGVTYDAFLIYKQ